MQKTVPVAIAAILLAIIGCESQDHALLRAIRQKNVEAVRTMVESGAELEPQSGLHDVNKPLAYAAAYGNLEIVKLLVEAGANLDGQVAYGDVALIKADEHENDEILKYLIEAGADVNVPNYYGVSPFIGLCNQGRLELVKLAAEYGGNVHASYVSKMESGAGQKNFSPLEAAAYGGRLEVVAFLLARGADAGARDYKGRTPLELAESKGHQEVAELLRKHMHSADGQ